MLKMRVVAAILELNTAAELAEFLDGLDALWQGERRWTAVTSDGVLRVPGDEYFLDAMIRSCELIPEASMRSLTGSYGVAALIEHLPECDLCHEAVARYDAKVAVISGWGYMCDGCYRMNSDRVLGVGVGQYLFTIEELTGPIRLAIDHIAAVCWPDQ